MAKFNFEDYRQPWETGPHWELKREFMEKYCNMFEEDRLLCLAQAYSNVVLMNCNYPAPVMQQISLLSKPLQMRKQFLENAADTDSPKNSQQQKVSEKLKSIYEQSGRPFKQIRFCSSSSKEQLDSSASSHSESPLGNSTTKPDSTYNVSTQNSEIAQSPSPKQTTISQKITPDAKSDFQSSDASPDEMKLLSVLGLELVQKLSEGIRNLQTNRKLSALEALLVTTNKLKIDGLVFEITEEPNCPKNALKFRSNLKINDCVIASVMDTKKKRAKLKSAETAVNVLFKLATSKPSTIIVVEEHVDTSENADCLKKHVITSENIDCKKEHGDASIYSKDECMKVLQIFSENIVRRTKVEPAFNAIKSIAKSLGMEDCVQLDFSTSVAPITSNLKASQTTEHTCKFYLKNILISCGKDNNAESAKHIAVDSGFIKLSNLSEFIIYNGALKDRYSCTDPNSGMNLKTPFIVNKYLLASSLRDGFVLLDKHFFRKDVQKNLRSLLVESAGFCHKKFEYQFEDIFEVNSIIRKAIISIEGVAAYTGIADSKDDAKTMACTRAVEDLRKKYYTIKVKNEYIEGYIVTRSQVIEGESYSSNVIAESNIGCKMLKNMGWSGGGLGSSGIAEPVEVQGVHSFGSGLGFQENSNDSRLFKKRLDAMLQEFSKTETFSDLIFSKEFTKDERKSIHSLAGKYSLHTQSRGGDKERFLTVRHKYDVTKLLKYLANNGGLNSKFELMDASKTSFLL